MSQPTLETLQSAGPAAPRNKMEAAVARLGPWFHNLHLPDGTQTAPDHPLGDFPAFKWRELAPHLPEDLTGWRALDIGANAGFYSFELARRGAEVVGLELDAHYLRQAAWAAERFGLAERVRFRQGSVYDVAELDGPFDLVLFMGVLYHLRYPLLALDLVAGQVGRLLVFQTLTMPGDEVAQTPENLPLDARAAMQQPGWPAMAFIEHRLAGDATNWWAPNAAACEAMLRSAGLRVTGRPGHELFLAVPAEQDAAAAARRAEVRAARGRPPAGRPAPDGP